METLVIIVSLVAFVVVVLTFLWVHKQVSDMTKAMTQLVGKLESLEAKVDSQERAVAEVRKALMMMEADPISQVSSIVGQFRQKGVIPGLLALGSTLFRAYSIKRRGSKALPARQKEKE